MYLNVIVRYQVIKYYQNFAQVMEHTETTLE